MAIIMVLLLYMILFMVISPYTYLMNTSHNKNRLIDDGWINIIRNISTKSYIFEAFTKLDCCKSNNNLDEINEIPENVIPEMRKVSDRKPPDDQMNPVSSRSDAPPKNNSEYKSSVHKNQIGTDMILRNVTNTLSDHNSQDYEMTRNNGDGLRDSLEVVNDSNSIETVVLHS